MKQMYSMLPPIASVEQRCNLLNANVFCLCCSAVIIMHVLITFGHI